ncbi:hypothetical protein ACT7CV_21415 [Bacillus paranthracis]
MKQTIIKVFFLATAAITARKDGSRNIKKYSDIYFLVEHLIAVRIEIKMLIAATTPI